MIRKGAVPEGKLFDRVRDLSRDDLAVLRETRDVPVVQRLRDPHHRLARLVATGLKPAQAAQQAGYSYGSLSILQKDPAFQDLVAHYRKIVDESFAESQDTFYELATSNMLKAERHLAERIEEKEEAGELLSVREALAISRDAADRFGYGKKTTNVNVNVDFAARLERASRRSLRVVEAAPVSPPAQVAGEVVPSAPHPPHSRVLRRA